MYHPTQPTNLLFFDIETASGTNDYSSLSPILQKHWERRAERTQHFDPHAPDYAERYADYAAIHAEFGRVVCVSCGVPIELQGGGLGLWVTSFSGPDERAVLEGFGHLLQRFWPGNAKPDLSASRKLVGHNIKGFDVPYLCRRYRLLGLPLPPPLHVWGRKPWELAHLVDTQELWQFGDSRSWVALELLTELFGLPTPKDALGGEYVTRAFWHDKNYEQIAVYCEADVLATSQVAFKLWGLEPIAASAVQLGARHIYGA
jgi:hypothetical protein